MRASRRTIAWDSVPCCCSNRFWRASSISLIWLTTKLNRAISRCSSAKVFGGSGMPSGVCTVARRSAALRRVGLKLRMPSRVRVDFIRFTIEVAAMWAVLTRLAEPKKAGITKLQKLKLYNGKSIPGFTEDSIKELKEEAPREGMQGISPRYIQDKISNALVSHQAQLEKAINPFMVMNELEGGLSHHSLITDEELKKEYKELLAVVREEYEDILKAEVQRAISADEDAIKRLATNYIENVRAYTQHERVRNRYTGRDEDPDERLMRSIEEKIDIPESRKDDFRQEIMNSIGAMALDC